MRKCRFCQQDIEDAARACVHCGRDLFGGHTIAAADAPSVPRQELSQRGAVRPAPSRFAHVMWGLSMAASIIGGLVGGLGIVGASGAPQEAAAAAIGCLIAIAPYTFARAVEKLAKG
jgi:hypothetical protein